MIGYWQTQFEHWITVRAKTQEARRRGSLLALFIVILVALESALIVISTWGWLVMGNSRGRSTALLALLEVGLLAVLWQLNRRGSTSLAAHLFLFLIIVATSVLPDSAFVTISYVAYIMPVILAGFILPIGWSFPYAALSALGYIFRYQFTVVSVPRNDLEIVIMMGLAPVTYLVALAAPAALAIDNARLYKETRRRLADLEILQIISTALRAAKTLDEALPIILDQLIDLLGVESALLDLLDPASGEIVTELARGVWAPVTGRRTAAGAGVSGRVISSGRAYSVARGKAEAPDLRADLVGGLKAVACVPIRAEHEMIGALQVGRYNMPITEEEIIVLTALGEMVGNTIHRLSLHEQTQQLIDDLQTSSGDLTRAYETTLEGWAKALELRDRETEGHSRRVTELTLQLARRSGIPESELNDIRRGVLLHDIGKMGIPDEVLRKTKDFTDWDRVEMQKHPRYAYDLLYPIAYLRSALDIPYCHHERWDGSGYPRRLKGEQIPLAARVFGVVDVWDALTNDRSYRKAWTKEKALAYIKEKSGSLFDPSIVDEFLKMMAEAPQASVEAKQKPALGTVAP